MQLSSVAVSRTLLLACSCLIRAEEFSAEDAVALACHDRGLSSCVYFAKTMCAMARVAAPHSSSAGCRASSARDTTLRPTAARGAIRRRRHPYLVADDG